MKRNLMMFIILSIIFFVPHTSFATEQSKEPALPETTEPSEELPTEPSNPSEPTTITFIYLDVESNEEIASRKTVSGIPETFTRVEIQSIPGYRVSDVMFVEEIDFLTKDYEFPIKYEKVENPYPNSEEEKTEVPTPVETTPSNPKNKNEETKENTNTPEQNTEPKTETEKEELTDNSKPVSEDQPTGSSAENIESVQPTTPTTSSTQPMSSQKEKRVAKKKPATKATGQLPNAGSQSQTALTVIGLGLITVGFLAYHRFKI